MWDERGNKRYFYRHVRIGGRPRRQYAGAGPAAELLAAEDAQRRAERRACAEARRQEQARCRAVDGLVLQLFELAGLIADAALVTRGYHKHGGEWRRLRSDGRRDGADPR